MSSDRVTRRRSISGLLLVGLIVSAPAQARAQQTSAPDEKVIVEAGVSVVSQYMFRGVRQNTTGVAYGPLEMFRSGRTLPTARSSAWLSE